MEELPDSVQCGTVNVPLDYARPDGKQIKLTVSRVEATRQGPAQQRSTGCARQGALVFNPGGPGRLRHVLPADRLPPGVEAARAPRTTSSATPRAGSAGRRRCPARTRSSCIKGPTPAPTHPSEAYKKERIARAKAYARGCARAGGSALRHYHSLNNARDLDVLRAALGEPRLTFMGASYGTYFGALYATLFPSHVRRMVFDSAVNPDPEQIWYRNNLDQSAAFEGRWADFRAWVARHDEVYGLGDTPEEVLRSYERAAARLAARAGRRARWGRGSCRARSCRPRTTTTTGRSVPWRSPRI